MMLSTLLSSRGGVMKPQVGCTTLRLVRDNKSIQTIMVPRPSYQTRLNQKHKQAQSKRRVIHRQVVYWYHSLQQTSTNELEAVGILGLQLNLVYISSLPMIRLSS